LTSPRTSKTWRRPNQSRSSLLPSPGKGILWGPCPPLRGSEMSESYAETPGAIGVHKALPAKRPIEFIKYDRNLTDDGMAAREVLLEEIEAIERDLEAIRQEHGLD
jgi:hypothetical protein